jgi:hypothetical protein
MLNLHKLDLEVVKEKYDIDRQGVLLMTNKIIKNTLSIYTSKELT